MNKDVRRKIFSLCEKLGLILVDDMSDLLDELRSIAVSDEVAATTGKGTETQ